MQDRETRSTSEVQSGTGTAVPRRKLRSLVLSWKDEETGDVLTVDVSGSERFLAGLGPLGFRPLEELDGEGSFTGPAVGLSQSSNKAGSPRAALERGRHPASKGSADRKESTAAGHRVRWTVRLARYWKPKSR